LKDDFQFDSGTYGYDESDDEWDDEEANWNGGEHEEEPTGEGKDESTAYLDFLNEEVSMRSIYLSCLRQAQWTLTDGPVPETC